LAFDTAQDEMVSRAGLGLIQPPVKTQVIHNTNRSKRKKRWFCPTGVHAGYTDARVQGDLPARSANVRH